MNVFNAYKHNALFEYIQKKSTEEKPLVGGVIVPRDQEYKIWKYAGNLIEKANDYTGWNTFEPWRN